MTEFLLRHYVRAAIAVALLDDEPHTRPDHDPADPADPGDPTERERTLRRRDAGQATTEYALVMLGAAAVALLVVTWATAGGGAGRIGRLFDRVIDAVLSRV